MTPPPIRTDQPVESLKKRTSPTKGKAVEGRKRIYNLETSEEIGSRSVCVKNDKGKIIWSKTRELLDDEIVETVFDSNRHPRWTIHKPIKGWYLALRNCAIPTASFIEFKPFTSPSSTASSSGSKATSTFTISLESALRFPITEEDDNIPIPRSPNVRLNFDQVEIGELLEEKKLNLIESEIDVDARHKDLLDVPTTPLTSTDATFISSDTSLENSDLVRSKFILQPVSTLHPHPTANTSNTSWGWHSIKNLLAGKGKDFAIHWMEQGMLEVVRFEEHTTILGVSTKGTIYLDENLIDIIGMEPSFWITSTLAYLEFLEDGEAYAAASQG